jgi:hypothetical protein
MSPTGNLHSNKGVTMSRSIRRCSALSLLASCAILAGPIVSAQASDTSIRATIVSWEGRIMQDENAVGQAVRGFVQDGQAAPVIMTMTREDRDLHTLIARLDAQSASTARGAQGKADVTGGLRLIATAYGDLAGDYRSMGTANPASPSKINATVSLDKQGRAKLKAGLRLLS